MSFSWPVVETIPVLCRNDAMCKQLASVFGPADLDVFKCGYSLDYGVRADAPLFMDGANKN